MKTWKKTVAIAAACVVVGVASMASAEPETYQGFPMVHVVVNGKPVTSDVPAVNFFGRTVLPVRAVAEAIGATVGWDPDTSTVTVTSKAAPQASDPGAPIYQLQGSGQSTSKIMTLARGAYVVTMSYKGTGLFSVTAYDTKGGYVGLLAGSLNDFSGSKVLVIDTDGKYIFDINAKGDWSFSVAPADSSR